MNRSELVRAVAERAGSDEAVARLHVDALVEAVMERVSAGDRVTVTGFGTFDRLSRPARSARNPRTGVPVEVPAAEVPRFRSGQTFRNRVAGGAPAAVEEQGVAAAAPPDATVSVVVEEPSPKKPKAAKKAESAKDVKSVKGAKSEKNSGKSAKKAKKGADAKKAKAGKADTSASPKKKQGKGKARAKAGK
ncbi:HU family DNA-binding protein [Spirillospora sp. NPDC048819]|uniref:HU family DNA-binding protein n=1 Tax=Spirillospora sp. NPDC048819 TaxID=3155268 RepID=UPI0033D299FB